MAGAGSTDRPAASVEHAGGLDPSVLIRIAARLGRIGGWSVELPSRHVRWSPELYELLDWPDREPPTLDEGLDRYLDPGALIAAIERCAADGIPFELEADASTARGRPLCLRLVGELERDAQGRPRRIVGAFQDITVAHDVQARTTVLAERLTATLEAIADACYALDDGWRFTFLNASAEQLVERTADELLGRCVWDEFPEAAGTEVEEAYRRARATGQPVRLERYWFPPLRRWFEISAHPWDDGLTVFFRDVSAHVAKEASLERTVRDERAVSERLRDLDRTKNAFLSAVSHELRTPLTVVRGMAHTLRDHRDELPPEVRRRVEDAMASSADRLDRLLRDLLDVDRLTHGGIACRRDRVDVVSLVRAICAEVIREGLLLDEPHVISPATLPADVDPIQLERVLHNLLENAGKYAPGASVRIELSALPEHGVRVEVHDDGPGIPSAELQRIFQPLHRADPTHPQPGTGVGLALVASFAQLHGGRAWAEPSPDGAHLVVELPGSGPATTATADPAVGT